MDYGRWNSLPVWNRALADFLQPLSPFASVLLIATGLLCIYIAWRYANRPELMILALAFFWSP